MKGVIVFLLLVLAPSANAVWEQFQNDQLNTGRASGAGYFNSKSIANFSINNGTNFQPLVSDINNDGKTEIIIFFNDSLGIFNPALDLIGEKIVGKLQGQPAIYDIDDDPQKEIIFISNISSTGYFFAYQYNGSFAQEFNFTVANGGVGSGIKCISIGSTKSCVFIDNKQYVHIVNLSSREDSSYNTSAYIDTREKVPAIGDLGNDGGLEAVFWFDENNDDRYGLMVFDLINHGFDFAFNKSGIVDDIIKPLGNRFALKGHPVLADLNNDGRLEIAISAFYDDACSQWYCNDQFTELFVYNRSGHQLFSRCEKGTFGHCGDGTSTSYGWEGTNPFVLDADSNNINEVCFIKDKKFFDVFANMSISCYNYSGSLVLESNLTSTTDSIKTATIADMDNDGTLEVITDRKIYNLKGDFFFSHEFGFNFGIPADLDGNNGLDMVLSKNSRTTVFLDSYNYSTDLFVESGGILFEKGNIKVDAHNNGESLAKDVGVLAINMNTLENRTLTADVRGSNNATLDFNLSLKEGDKLLVQLDFENKINESNEENNFAFKEFIDFPLVYFSVDLEFSNIENEFIDFIKDNLKFGYYTSDENNADVKVYIGKNNIVNKQKIIFTKNNFDFYYDFGNIYFLNEIGAKPYNAIIGAYKENNIVNVLIYGNEIDGNIAALKEFINKQNNFLNINNNDAFFIDDFNLIAIKVFDFLHNTGNEANYNKNNDAFRQIVRNALRDEMFAEKDFTVNSASGVSLRLRNLKPNASDMYLSYLNSTGIPIDLPVVLARGLWSNLSAWQVLASELANEGRDAWLIEITGGPGQDCDTCPDYTFDNLTDDYVPSLLNGVLTFTGKDKIQYVGFSNGCRATLSSLEKGKFDPSKVETFVGVGCPGAFEGSSIFGTALNKLGDNAISEFRSQGISHVSFRNVFEAILPTVSITGGVNKISVNLFEKYYNFSADDKDKQPGDNVVLNSFAIIQGDIFGDNDGIVTTNDEREIFNKINASPKKYFRVLASHATLPDRTRTKSLIKKTLNNESLSLFERTFLLIDQG